jgi:DNA polymerase-3 subunit gamma/tau
MKLANLTHVLQLNSLAAVDETAKKKVEPERPQPVTAEPNPPVYEKTAVTQAASASNPTAVTVNTVAKPSKLRSTTQLIAPVQGVDSTQKVEAKSDTSFAAIESGKIEELTFENLQSAWYEFAEKRRQVKNSTTEEIALRKEFRLNTFTIEILLDNDHQFDAIQGMRYDLLGFLKSRFNEPKLDIAPRVAPQEVNRLPYTPAEKFSYLAEKNPHLLELKQALGLDVDF